MDANRALMTDNEAMVVQTLDNLDKCDSEEDEIFDQNLKNIEKYSSESDESGQILLDEDEIYNKECEDFYAAESTNARMLGQQETGQTTGSSDGSDFGDIDIMDLMLGDEAEKLAKEFVKKFSKSDFIENLEEIANLTVSEKNDDKRMKKDLANKRAVFDFHTKKAIGCMCPNLNESEVQAYCEYFFQTLSICKVIENS